MPETMKAVRYDRYGGPEVLATATVARPEPAPGQVLVRVRAASVNPVDWKLRSGAMKSMLALTFPVGAGEDLAGEVAALGAGVDGLAVGDAVYAMLGMTDAGAYAQYVALDQGAVARKPASLDMVAASAVPMGALTAWQAVVVLGGLKVGDRLFVHAAGGNVGGWAVRLAHALGAHVTAAGSAASRPAIEGAGADSFVDYDAGPFEEAAGEMDIVLDTLAGEMQARSWGLLKPGGILVSTLYIADPEQAKARGVRAASVSAQPDAGQLAHIAKVIEAGKLTPNVARIMSLDQAAEAQALAQSGAVKGKIVLTVD